MFFSLSVQAKLVLLSNFLLPTEDLDNLKYRWRLADAIVSVTDNEHEQRILMSLIRWETNYIERLSSPRCECKKQECDNGRARGPWQIIPYNGMQAQMLCVSLEDDAKIALERIRESANACRHLPANERLAVYTRGRCSSAEGRKLSRTRWVK